MSAPETATAITSRRRVKAERAYRVVDLSLHVPVLDAFPPTTDDLERFLDDEYLDGWDLVTAVDGVFSAERNPDLPGRKAPPPRPRTLLVMRRSPSHVREERPAPPRGSTVVADVVRRAAEAFHVQPTDVLSRPFKRTRHVAMARHVAAHVLRATGLSYSEVGTAMGHMEHTSVMNACRRVEGTPDLLAVALSLAAPGRDARDDDDEANRRAEEEG